MYTRFLKYAAMAAVALALVQTPSASSAQAENISIGAMRPGSAWYVFAATLSNLLKPALGGAKVDVIARGGGVSNPAAVDQKKATIALSNVATAVWAFEGNKGPYKKKYDNIRALMGGLNAVRVTAVLTQKYIDRTGNDTLEKALKSDKPARIVMKPAGSSVPVVADMLMVAMGTSRADIKKRGGTIIQVAANQIPAVIRDGRADLYFEVAIPGHPTLTEVTLTNKMKFLAFPKDAIAKLAKQGLQPAPVFKWFKGIDKPVPAVDLGTVLIAHKDMSDDMAYKITKILAENSKAMGKAHKAWLRFKPELGAKPAKRGIPLHPGSARYFKEKGWL
jgi:TRAP transporter TAXI family solute receptor